MKTVRLRSHKTKIVCTIGPASESPEILKKLMDAGMDIARLNFSHGDREYHRSLVAGLREAAAAAHRQLTIMGDLPGPKIRIGQLEQEPMELEAGDTFTLTVHESANGRDRIRVNFDRLPQVVAKGDTLYLNDGLIQVKVATVSDTEVLCRVLTGGELRSHKGLNFPGISLGISAFTEADRQWLQFARQEKLDAVSQSFVEKAEDVEAVRQAAAAMDYHPYIFAKIERAGALKNINGILRTADGIMIARGDLGVEVPIEQIAGIQKDLIRMVNGAGKPVITATQMLESMTGSRRPTRAEVTDVANAILDGSDCVMLSGESAIGGYPVDAVQMLAKIATAIESRAGGPQMVEKIRPGEPGGLQLRDEVAWSVGLALQRLAPAFVLVPTRGGATARTIARFRSPAWILAVSSRRATCRELGFTFGVQPFFLEEHPADWNEFALRWLREQGLPEDIVLLAEGPSTRHPEANHRMELIDLRHGRNTGPQDVITDA